MYKVLESYGLPFGKSTIRDAMDAFRRYLGIAHADMFDVRAALASSSIPDQDLQELGLAAAALHMLSRRGQRNPWKSLASVKSAAATGYSVTYDQLVERSGLAGQFVGKEPTPAELISAVRYNEGHPNRSTKALPVKIAQGMYHDEKAAADYEEAAIKKREEGKPFTKTAPVPGAKLDSALMRAAKPPSKPLDPDLLAHERARLNRHLVRQTFQRSDLVREFECIADIQGLDPKISGEIIDTIIYQESPTRGLENRIGWDDLPLLDGDKRMRRAPMSALAFQRFRIAGAVTNLRLPSGNRLTIEQIGAAFSFLGEWRDPDDKPEWSDVAEHLGVERLTGRDPLGKPPVNTTALAFHREPVSGSPIAEFWNRNVDRPRIRKTMISVIAGHYSPEKLHHSVSDDECTVSEWLDSCNDEILEVVLDGIKLETGRAAHSEKNLDRLTEHMLATGSDLYESRRVLFDVSESWRPEPNPLGTFVGNPVVDTNVKLVRRVLQELIRNIGSSPAMVVLESTRDLAMNQSNAEKLHDKNAKRRDRKAALAEQLGGTNQTKEHQHRSLIHAEQHGLCLYCGTQIDMDTAQIDHIVPRTRGGTYTRLNQAMICQACNHDKSNRPLIVWLGGKDSDQFKAVVTRARKIIPTHDAGEDRQVDKDENDKETKLKATSSQKGKRSWIRKYVAQLSASECERPLESVSWAATEIRDQLLGYLPDTEVRIVSGRITSSVRKMGKLDNDDAELLYRIPGYRGKSRLDRRHHAIDAAVLTLVRQRDVTVITERNSMKSAMRGNGDNTTISPDGRQISWWNYTGSSPADQESFRCLRSNSDKLRELLRDKFTHDTVPVIYLSRLSPDTAGLHNEKPVPLIKLRVGEVIPLGLVKRACTPTLWRALVTHPDYSDKTGLQINPLRELRVGGRTLRFMNEIGFFASKQENSDLFLGNALKPHQIDRIASTKWRDALRAHPSYDEKSGLPADAQRCLVVGDRVFKPDHMLRTINVNSRGGTVLVRGGQAGGIGVHHTRLAWKPNSDGNSEDFGRVRVYQNDAAALTYTDAEWKRHRADVFATKLPDSCLSMRDAGPENTAMVSDKNADHAVIVTGDVVVIPPDRRDALLEGVQEALKFMDRGGPEREHRLVIRGVRDSSSFRVQSALLAAEGIPSDKEFDEWAQSKHHAKTSDNEFDDENPATDTESRETDNILGVTKSTLSSLRKLCGDMTLGMRELRGLRVERTTVTGQQVTKGNRLLRSQVL
jgi:CRISPR-associated endonuclease Csn1